MTIIVGVCGGSGSGKTTLADRLVASLGPDRTRTLSFDSYYRDFSHLEPAQRAEVNFDHPDSLDIDLLASHLDAIRADRSIGVPTYDFSTHTRSDTVTLVDPPDYLIIDGILLLSLEAVRDRLDHSVFRQCPAEVRLERRMLRDVASRGRTPDSVTLQWKTTVQPMHEVFVEPFASHADLVVPHGYDLDFTTERIAEALEQGRRLSGCLSPVTAADEASRRLASG